MSSENIFTKKETYSKTRLAEFRNRLSQLSELKDFQTLTIFAAGSYGRLEASEYSDLDIFFLCSGSGENIPEKNTKSLRLFGKIIDLAHVMGFPRFSNDCKYLTLIHTDEVLNNLGNSSDDEKNYFTARMLLLLESRCLFGDTIFNEIISNIVDSYYKDFPDHSETFQPIFLLNDICRFWKTLLLNYENKRNIKPGAGDEEQKRLKQKVRNFKLKFSRLTTCFATMAALGSHTIPVTKEQIIALTFLTPRERLHSISSNLPRLQDVISEILEKYNDFLRMTDLPTIELEKHFSDKQKRIEMFHKASIYGDSMFELLRKIDDCDPKLRLLRYLVV